MVILSSPYHQTRFWFSSVALRMEISFLFFSVFGFMFSRFSIECLVSIAGEEAYDIYSFVHSMS